MELKKDRVLAVVKAALKEDIGPGDITTAMLVDRLASSTASVVVKEPCVVCGLLAAELAMAQVDYSVRFRPNVRDGSFVGSGKEIIFLEGHTASILKAERTMVNFLSFLSGIATRTKEFVDIARPYGVKIMDTRKTLPLLRYLEKYAVFTGGGTNHRMGLYDQVLIKDNHISAQRMARSVQRNKKITIKDMVERCRKNIGRGIVVEVEVSNIGEFNDALSGKPDIIMLDNMRAQDVKACVEIRRLAKMKPSLEVSGGVTLDNVEEYAKTRVDMISVGSLTNSASSIDMSLEMA